MLRVHSCESMGTVDGPGLRFVIFLQGCNFKCLYCANPDTIEMGGGELIPEDDLFERVFSQKPYFGRRGGVTFSGGEATLQAKSLIPLVERFKAAGIHTCIDTNGGVWNRDVERLYELTDLVLLDVKQINVDRHRSLTGVSNAQTLRTAKWLEEHSKPIWLRYVLVSGLTTLEEDLRTLGENLGEYKMVERVEILPYHRLGVHKYEAMGWEYALSEVKECSGEELSLAEKTLSRYFKQVLLY